MHKFNRLLILLLATFTVVQARSQTLAAFHDNQDRFFIFDDGKIIQAEHLPVKSFRIGGNCVLYINNRSNLQMYYKGEISTLEVGGVNHYEAMDYLAVYSIGDIVKIIENGHVVTISTHAIKYQAEDSLVAFFDASRQMLATYYKGEIHMLEDGLAGRTVTQFRSADNLVAYVSSRTNDLSVFHLGKIREVEQFLPAGSFKAGRGIIAYISPSEQRFKVYFGDEVYVLEDFPPLAYQAGDEMVAYVDNSGSFKVFQDGETIQISSFKPDFFQVHNKLIVYGEQGYFKTWYDYRPYLLETYTPGDWKAEWNTIIYRDVNRNVKLFSRGTVTVLTYDLVEGIDLYRDVIVVNKGMNNCNVYYKGKKY